MKDKDSEPSPMPPPTTLYDKPLKINSKKQELSNIDQSEEGAGLIYTNEGQGLWAKSNDTTLKFVRQTVNDL